MARVFLVLGTILILAGMWIGWPLIHAASHLTRIRGHVLDVLSTPLPDGHVRMAVAYQFTIPGKPRETVLSYRLADRSFTLAEHLDLPASRAEFLGRTLPGQWLWVFYDVNDPAGSAFMMTEGFESAHLRAEHGVLLLLLGIACWSLSWFNRRRSTGG